MNLLEKINLINIFPITNQITNIIIIIIIIVLSFYSIKNPVLVKIINIYII